MTTPSTAKLHLAIKISDIKTRKAQMIYLATMTTTTKPFNDHFSRTTRVSLYQKGKR